GRRGRETAPRRSRSVPRGCAYRRGREARSKPRSRLEVRGTTARRSDPSRRPRRRERATPRSERPASGERERHAKACGHLLLGTAHMIAAYTSICLDARISSPVRGSQPSPCQWVGMGDLQIARLGAETENLSVRERARRAAALRTRRERTRPQASFVPPALFLRAPRTPGTRKPSFERLHRDIPIARLTRAHDPPRARNCTRARNFRERDGCGASCNQFRHATCSEGRSPFAVSSPPLACNSHGWTKVR